MSGDEAMESFVAYLREKSGAISPRAGPWAKVIDQMNVVTMKLPNILIWHSSKKVIVLAVKSKISNLNASILNLLLKRLFVY